MSNAQQAVLDAETAGRDTADNAAAKARENLEKAEKYAKRQFRDHAKLLEGMVKRIMKVITTTSLQYKKDWTERVVEDLDPSSSYTAYDIMTLILDTQIIVKSDDTVEKMRKSMMKLPYQDYAEYRDAVIDKLALFKERTKKANNDPEEGAA